MTFPSTRFTWFEYATADRARAQGFYGELFHWTTKPVPTGPETYDLITSGEQSIGAYRDGAAGAHWLAYLLVEDVRATVAKARAAGGKVVQDVTPRGGAGHYAILVDPQGAQVALWQPTRRDHGAEPPQVIGTPCWAELFTSHAAAAVNFYEAIGDLRDEPAVNAMGAGTHTYHVLASGGGPRAGVMDAPMPGIAPHWKPYIHVANTDATLVRAQRLGATIGNPAHDVPHVGRIAIVIDPLGAPVGILQPATTSRAGS